VSDLGEKPKLNLWQAALVQLAFYFAAAGLGSLIALVVVVAVDVLEPLVNGRIAESSQRLTNIITNIERMIH
jgi:uncharacterized membrane protein YqjE